MNRITHAAAFKTIFTLDKKRVKLRMRAKAAQFWGFFAGCPFQTELIVEHHKMSITIVIAFKIRS